MGISIVMPSLNQGQFIAEALNSLLDQAYEDLEVIVVDGGSTDGTLDILASYAGRVRSVSESDGGQAEALAKGFAIASRPWLGWLNSDDLQTNDALRRIASAVRDRPDADVVVGKAHYVDRDGRYMRPYPRMSLSPGTDVTKELFARAYVPQPSVFFRRAAYDAVGGIDPTLHGPMDYDLWVRLARAGRVFVDLDHDISANRWYEGTKSTSQHLSLLAEVVSVQQREFGRVSPYFVQGVSDYVCRLLGARGPAAHRGLLIRTLYFKSIWMCLNYRRPLYCIRGLLTTNIAISGADGPDRVSWRELCRWVRHSWRHTLPGRAR